MARSRFDFAADIYLSRNQTDLASISEMLALLDEVKVVARAHDRKLWRKGKLSMKEAQNRQVALNQIKLLLQKAEADRRYYSSVPAPRP